RHPYTKALLSAIPIADPRQMRVWNLGLIEGDSVTVAGSDGCAFAARCPHRFAPCDRQVPLLIDIAGGQRAACFLNEPDHQQGDSRP
ncbi:MAG TPA: oligopeptide/dipeptide ABC transporter ATP-binding protein, partial [Nordella sp.]|nr:oligopeptide/dipeptide ABC transporter ATP-binding protein [Nordella sp.]